MPRQSVQDFLIDIIDIINEAVIPFLFAIAFFFFIWNAAKYFVFKGTTEEGRDSAKRLMFYGIAAMVLMLSLWGLVRLMTSTFGINRSFAPCPDFNPNCFDTGSGRGGFFDDMFSGRGNIDFDIEYGDDGSYFNDL